MSCGGIAGDTGATGDERAEDESLVRARGRRGGGSEDGSEANDELSSLIEDCFIRRRLAAEVNGMAGLDDDTSEYSSGAARDADAAVLGLAFFRLTVSPLTGFSYVSGS